MRLFRTSHTALALAVAASVSASVAVKAQNPAEPAPPVGLAGNGLIAFGSGSDIWIAEPDGSDPRQLTSGPALESMPYWSPDGTRLAYWSQVERSAPSQLIVVNVDGTEPTTIATHADGQLPIRTDWSPDGTRLAYSICPDGTGNACSTERVLVAAADGSGSSR